MLPLPYGLLPHEAIEVIDNERLIPGLTKIFKFAEDFPYLDHHSLNKEKEEYESFRLLRCSVSRVKRYVPVVFQKSTKHQRASTEIQQPPPHEVFICYRAFR
jgi:hypothetical protein